MTDHSSRVAVDPRFCSDDLRKGRGMQRHAMSRRDFTQILASGPLLAAHSTGASAQDPNPPFAFGVVADVQYANVDPVGSRYYRESRDKLADCIQQFNQMELAFVVDLGDLIDRDFDSFGDVLPIYNHLKWPHHHVLGNHDFSVEAARIDEVPGRIGLPHRYYAFHHQSWRFLVLDGNDVSLFGRPQSTPEYREAERMYESLRTRKVPWAQTWNGAIGRKQIEWLQLQLDEASQQQERVVIFCHYPVYPDNAHNLWNSAELLDVFDHYPCIVAYLNGHNHAGNYAQRAGIHYLTIPGMVETPNTTAFAVVRVDPNQLEVIAGDWRLEAGDWRRKRREKNVECRE